MAPALAALEHRKSPVACGCRCSCRCCAFGASREEPRLWPKFLPNWINFSHFRFAIFFFLPATPTKATPLLASPSIVVAISRHIWFISPYIPAEQHIYVHTILPTISRSIFLLCALCCLLLPLCCCITFCSLSFRSVEVSHRSWLRAGSWELGAGDCSSLATCISRIESRPALPSLQPLALLAVSSCWPQRFLFELSVGCRPAVVLFSAVYVLGIVVGLSPEAFNHDLRAGERQTPRSDKR